MTSKKNSGFRASFGNAFTGFTSALRTERNLKIHFVAAFLAIVAGFLFTDIFDRMGDHYDYDCDGDHIRVNQYCCGMYGGPGQS